MNDFQARLAVRVLRRGGLVLHPTEGVWGLACDPFDAHAVERLLACKGRNRAKGLIVIGAASECFEPELAALDPRARSEVEGTWPGPVTWILPNRHFPAWITGGRDTVAVRVPGHPAARALCRAFGGPLVSTSANRAGRPPARNRFQAMALASAIEQENRAGRALLYPMPGETRGRRTPSELRTLSGTTLRRSR